MTADATQAFPSCPDHGPGASQAVFATVVATSPVPTASTDVQGIVRSWNQAAERLLGYATEEMPGRPLLDLFPPDQQSQVRTLLEQVRAGEAIAPFAAAPRRKDGTLVPVTVTLWGIRGAAGALLGLGVAWTDRTAQDQAENEARWLRADLERRLEDLARTSEALRQSEDRFRLLVDGVQDYAILMLHPDGRVASWNRGAERIKGYQADEVLGRHFSLFYPPEAIEQGWPQRELETAAAAGRIEDEGWRVRKDGSRFWANVVITALRDRTGQLVGFSKVSRDLTERKQADDIIRRLNTELEQRVRERTAELEAAIRDLGQKNAENEMFVYSVSHDLRSPLVNLQGFSRELEKACRGLAELLASETVPENVRERGQSLLDGKVAMSVGFIQTAVTRLSNIIDALLRLSRAGRVEYSWEAVDMTQMVAQVVKAAHLTITERGADVRIGALPPAWGDRTALEQAFANLLSNALKYLDPARPGVIEIGVIASDPADTAWTYFVRDNGRGVPEDNRERIFQAFQRAHPGVGSGEGLGLAIVARVVERHHGRVWVVSRPGEGSTFFVTLPGGAGRR